MLRIGITGNIGTGKSTVCKIFESLGIPVYSADKEAKLLYKLPDVIAKVKALFGNDVFDEDGNLLNFKLAEKAFGDSGKLKKLNAIIHPLVLEHYLNWASHNKQQAYTIYESALLVESGFIDHFDKSILVIAPQKLAMERVINRDGIDEKDFLSRAEKQLRESEKIPVADYIIHNDGSEALIPQVIDIHKSLSGI